MCGTDWSKLQRARLIILLASFVWLPVALAFLLFVNLVLGASLLVSLVASALFACFYGLCLSLWIWLKRVDCPCCGQRLGEGELGIYRLRKLLLIKNCPSCHVAILGLGELRKKIVRQGADGKRD